MEQLTWNVNNVVYFLFVYVFCLVLFCIAYCFCFIYLPGHAYTVLLYFCVVACVRGVLCVCVLNILMVSLSPFDHCRQPLMQMAWNARDFCFCDTDAISPAVQFIIDVMLHLRNI